MFGALALMPIDKIDECLSIIASKAQTLNVAQTKLQDFTDYFVKTWMQKWKPKIWNYYDHIGRRTTNDLENFNKHSNFFF